MSAERTPILPGRLGRPDMALKDDPRADPRMIAAMEPIGLAAQPAPSPVDAGSELDALLEYVAASEAGFEALFGLLGGELPPIGGVTSSVEIIRGIDGNDITLFIHKPAEQTGPLPGVLHIHGGGMVLLEAAGPGYVRWRDQLAATGMVVVGVEFRNGGGKHGPHPFPAGLNDCTSALRWMGEHQERLGISKIVVSGESGGGNLTLATTLQAKRNGDLGLIAGVYAQCPYISGVYASPPAALPSLVENDGYFLAGDQMGALAKVYDPNGANATNPLAWPYHAIHGRSRRATSARHLGESARPAARRGTGVRQEAPRRRRIHREPYGQRHLSRRGTASSALPCPTSSRPPCGTSRASPTRSRRPGQHIRLLPPLRHRAISTRRRTTTQARGKSGRRQIAGHRWEGPRSIASRSKVPATAGRSHCARLSRAPRTLLFAGSLAGWSGRAPG